MDLLSTTGISIGDRIEAIAYCSNVEVLQNLTAVGSFREIYHLHGMTSSYMPAILFKQGLAKPVDKEAFRDEPVMVTGTVSEYKGVLQIHIESITPVGKQVDVNDLLSNMVDTRLIDEVNDLLFSIKSLTHLGSRFLKPAMGLDGSLAGTLALRLHRFISIGLQHFNEETLEYVENLSLLAEFYLDKEGTMDERLDFLKHTDSRLIRAILFGVKSYPEYDEFVKLHYLLMKPKGYEINIVEVDYEK